MSASANPEQIIQALATTREWQPSSISVVSEDRVLPIQHELEVALSEYRRITNQLYEAELFAKETEGYSNEATEQRLRLEAVNVVSFPDHDATKCPLCSSVLASPIASVTAIHAALGSLRSSLAGVGRDRPRLREHIDGLQTTREQVRAKITQLQETIDAIQNEQAAAQQFRDANARVARVVGRISLYLETLSRIDERAELRDRVDNARTLVDGLESQLESTDNEDILHSVLSSISNDMTEWAKKLQMEFSGSPYRLDLKRLTVVVDRSGRPIFMNQGLGGGENWLGCHIIALMAIHKYFIEQGRPVPGFLFLDQPSQVYFPAERYSNMEGRLDELSDEDRVAVSRMFNLLFDVGELLAPNLQIIVTDHANLDTPRFQSALVEAPWTGDKGLVPQSWFSIRKDDDSRKQ